MDITKYEVLLNVVDRGGFNRVCDDMGYTRSALSKMMSSLESEIGFPLIVRTNKGVTLTAEGERVLPYIRQLVQDNVILEEEFALVRGIEIGTVRIGCFPTTAFAWIPEVLQGFQIKHPNIHIEIIEENSIKQLEMWLNQGVIDIAVMSRQKWHAFDWIGVLDDPYVALLSREHPLADNNSESLSVAELMEKDLILAKSHEGFDQDISKLIAKSGVKADLKYTTNSDFTAIRMVAENGFITILPRLIAEYGASMYDLVWYPLDITVKREIGVAVKDKHHLTPAAEKFLQHARSYLFHE